MFWLFQGEKIVKNLKCNNHYTFFLLWPLPVESWIRCIMEPPLTVLAVTRRRKEVSRILQLWMALQSSMETLNGMRTQERRKSTTLWWNRRAWLHLRIEEDNKYWIKEMSQLSKCTLGSNIVLFTFVHCLCIWCYLFSFFSVANWFNLFPWDAK